MKFQNNLENGSFRNRENLQFKKISDSALFSLFMRTIGNGNLRNGNLQFSPPHSLAPAYKRYSAFCQNPIFLKDFDFPCSGVFMLINVKIPTIFDILTFMSMINFMLS